MSGYNFGCTRNTDGSVRIFQNKVSIYRRHTLRLVFISNQLSFIVDRHFRQCIKIHNEILKIPYHRHLFIHIQY